jgi:hypothetical protein
VTGRVPISSDKGLLDVDPDRNRMLSIHHMEKIAIPEEDTTPLD